MQQDKKESLRSKREIIFGVLGIVLTIAWDFWLFTSAVSSRIIPIQ